MGAQGRVVGGRGEVEGGAGVERVGLGKGSIGPWPCLSPLSLNTANRRPQCSGSSLTTEKKATSSWPLTGRSPLVVEPIELPHTHKRGS